MIASSASQASRGDAAAHASVVGYQRALAVVEAPLPARQKEKAGRTAPGCPVGSSRWSESVAILVWKDERRFNLLTAEAEGAEVEDS